MRIPDKPVALSIDSASVYTHVEHESEYMKFISMLSQVSLILLLYLIALPWASNYSVSITFSLQHSQYCSLWTKYGFLCHLEGCFSLHKMEGCLFLNIYKIVPFYTI